MNLEEKKVNLKNLADSTSRLLTTLSNTSDALFSHQPPDNRWSIAELVEHIILVEQGVLMGLKKFGASPAKETIVTELDHASIMARGRNRNRKIEAPAQFIPKGIFTTKAAAIEAFSTHRASIDTFINTTTLPLELIGFPHPALGMLNGFNWLSFMSAHCERHVLQMEEIVNK